MRPSYETSNFNYYCDIRKRIHGTELDVHWVLVALSEGRGGGYKLLCDPRGFLLYDEMNDSSDVPDLRLKTDADITAFKLFLRERNASHAT